MNYSKIYDDLISSRKQLNRNKNENVYYENHHIIPRCFGGSNKKENLVLLTFKEHFVAHLLLKEIHVGKNRSKMCFALWHMCNDKNNPNRVVTSRQYETHKKALRDKGVQTTGKEHPFYGKKHTDFTKNKISVSKIGQTHTKEAKIKISEAGKGRVPSNKGIPNSIETRRKISEKNKGKKVSDETKAKMSKAAKGKRLGRIPANKGIPMSEEAKKKLSESRKGIFPSEEVKQKMSEGLKNSAKKKAYSIRMEKPLPCSVEEFKNIIINSNINLKEYGWSEKVAALFNVKAIMLRTWMQRHIPEIYDNCFKRRTGKNKKYF